MNIVAEDGEGYVDVIEPTNRATATDPGVIKASPSYGITVDSSGQLAGYTRSLAQYRSGGSGIIVSKGTLENILEDMIGSIIAPGLTPGNTLNGRISVECDASGKHTVRIINP